MAILKRDQVVAHREMRTETVPVPEWGGDIIIKELTGRERDEWEASFQGKKKGEINWTNFRARLIVACAVDEAGQPLFYPSDVDLVGELSAAALDRVFSAARRLSGLSDQDIDELAKN